MRIKLPKSSGQLNRFVVVGIFNTGLDFALLNILLLSGLSLLPANFISVSVSMIVSFYLNYKYVFRANSENALRTFVGFILVTAIGLYVVQSAAIVGLGYVAATYNIQTVASMLVINNCIKLIATFASSTWNYLAYKYTIFSK